MVADCLMSPLQSPSTRIGYTLCTIEHFVGLMMSSCLLGIVFARASIPTARMAFSKVCLITTRLLPLESLLLVPHPPWEPFCWCLTHCSYSMTVLHHGWTSPTLLRTDRSQGAYPIFTRMIGLTEASAVLRMEHSQHSYFTAHQSVYVAASQATSCLEH